MSQGAVAWVIVGADRVAANGDKEGWPVVIGEAMAASLPVDSSVILFLETFVNNNDVEIIAIAEIPAQIVNILPPILKRYFLNFSISCSMSFSLLLLSADTTLWHYFYIQFSLLSVPVEWGYHLIVTHGSPPGSQRRYR